MLFNIAPTNAERARRAFTAEPNTHAHGYTNGAILRPKNNRLSYYYEISTLEKFNLIVCTVRHKEVDTIEAVITLSDYTPDSIEVRQGELYRNCSNYPYRTETNPRYMKKYLQIACIVHGAITAGLLFNEEQPETAPEPIQAGETTTDAEKPENGPEPEQATEPTSAPEKGQDGPKTGPTEDRKTETTQTQMETTGAPEETAGDSQTTMDSPTEAPAEADPAGRYQTTMDGETDGRYQTAMEDTSPAADHKTDGRPDSSYQTPMDTAGDSQTPMEDGRPAPAADGQTVMEDGGKAGQPADGQTSMDGDKAGGRQTGMEPPEKARNSPTRAEPLQTTTRDGNGPKCAKNRPYTPRPELSTIYTRGSPAKTVYPMTTGQGGQL